MILVDANVLMYAAGAEHPHKTASLQLLERVARGDLEGVLDSEVLQEKDHLREELLRVAREKGMT